MKKLIYSILISFVTFLMSCSEEVNDPKSGIDSSIVSNILDGKIVGDPFRILSLKIEDGKLHLKVEYGGGCEDHDFSLIWNGECSASDSELKTQFAIIHDANNDLCEALLTKEIVLDYQSIEQENVSIESCGALSFINASNQESFLVGTGMENIAQGRECIMEVELEEAICGIGFLGNLWFKSTDTSLFSDSDFFYFQPTQIAVDQVFDKGKYLIGVKIVERYETDEATCLAYPGPSIPAEILCIDEISD